MALAGCGRIGFGESTRTDDAAIPDVPMEIDAPTGPTTPAFVAVDVQSGGTVTSLAGKLAGIETGDLFVVAIAYDEDVPITPQLTDTFGTSFTLLGPNDGDVNRQYIAYGISSRTGTDELQLTISAAAKSYVQLRPHAYRNLDPVHPFDAYTEQTGTVPGMQPAGTITTTVDETLVFEYCVLLNGGASAGAGMTVRTSTDADITADKVTTTAGVQSVPTTTTSGIWTLSIAAFRGK